MQTQLIEIVPDQVEESPGDRALLHVRDGRAASGAALIATSLVNAGVGITMVGAGLASGVSNGVAWLRGSDQIEEIELSKAVGLHDEQGLPVQANRIYALHPDEARPNLAILASDFYDIVIAEQIADLVEFIRSTVRAESIDIDVISEHTKAGSLFSKIGFGMKGNREVAKRHSVQLRYENPDLITSEKQPFWLRLFPDITASFRAAQRGSVRRSVSVDTTFGLNASLAEKAGMDVSGLGKQRFSIETKFL